MIFLLKKCLKFENLDEKLLIRSFDNNFHKNRGQKNTIVNFTKSHLSIKLIIIF